MHVEEIENVKKINAQLIAIYLFIEIIFSFFRVLSVACEIGTLNYPIGFILKLIILSFMIVNNRVINKKFILYSSILVAIIIIDFIFYRIFIADFYKKIIVNGIFTLYLLSNPFDTRELLKRLRELSFVVIGVYTFFMLFLHKPYFSIYNYMDVGFSLLFPNLLMLISYIYERKKEYLFFWVVSLILILIYGNRSPVVINILTVIILFKHLKIVERWFLMILVPTLLLALKPLVLYLYNFAFFKSMRLMQKFWHYFTDTTVTGLGSGRNELYSVYIEYIKDSPFLGNGFQKGLYEQGLGYYSHNIAIDFLFNFGILFGTALFILLIFTIITFFVKNNNIEKEKLMILLLALSFQLLFSNYYIENFYFYLLIAGLLYLHPANSNYGKIN